MAKLKIQTGDGIIVPGQQDAEKHRQEQEAKAEYDANSLFGAGKTPIDAGPDYTYKKIRFHKNDEINPYADQQDERYGLDARVKKIIILAVAVFLAFFIACVIPVNVFDVTRVDRTIGTLAAEMATQAQGFIGFFLDPNTIYGTYMLTILVSLLAGAAMGLSGGVYQGALKNALASPSTLGVTSGGTLGAIIFALVVYPESQTLNYNGSATDLIAMMENMPLHRLILEEYGAFLFSLLGCLIVVGLVLLIAFLSGRGKVNNVSLVVAGQVFASSITVVLGFAQSWISNHGDPQTAMFLAQKSVSTFTGSYTLVSVSVFAIPLLLCMAFVFINAGKLSLLAFNDEEARSMGISTMKMRVLMVGTCTLLTALVISFCGPVGFVGFLVPHMARKLVGPDFRYLLPACALMGALMVTVVFAIAHMGIPFITSNSTGAFTSLIGCVAFLVIALRSRRSSGGEWL